MKVFISGPMKGYPNNNKEAFDRAEKAMKAMGYSVFNPSWCQYGNDTEFTEDDMHAIANEAIRRCDMIYMLRGWGQSVGAKAEYELAKKLVEIHVSPAEAITIADSISQISVMSVEENESYSTMAVLLGLTDKKSLIKHMEVNDEN